jgi:flagellar hook-length control protein FliK
MKVSPSSLPSTIATSEGGAGTGKAPGTARTDTGFAAVFAQLDADGLAAQAPLAEGTVHPPAADLLATLMQHLAEAGLSTASGAPMLTATSAHAAAPDALPQPTLNALLEALRTFAPTQGAAASVAPGTKSDEQDAGTAEPIADDADLDALPPALLALLQQLGVVPPQQPTAIAGPAATPQAVAATVQSVAPALQPARTAASATPTKLPPDAVAAPSVEPARTADEPAIAMIAGTGAHLTANKEPSIHNDTHLSQATPDLLKLMTQTSATPTEPSAAATPLVHIAAPAGTVAPPALPAVAAPVSTLLLAVPLDTPPWRVEFGQQLAQLALKPGDQRVSLQLHPAELGPLTVELRVRDGQADIQFLSPHLQVRSAVSEALPQLREALAHQGIALGETGVGNQERQGHWQAAREQEPAPELAVESGAVPRSDDAAADARRPRAPRGQVNLYV